MLQYSYELWKQLEQMAEHNPHGFLKDYDQLFTELSQPHEQQMLSYFKAKSLYVLHDYTLAEKTILRLLEKAIVENDYSLIAKSNLLLSKCYPQMGLANRERPTLELALSAAKQARDYILIIEVLCGFSASYLKSHDRTNTFLYLQKAEKALPENADPNLRLKILIETSTAYFNFNQQDKATLVTGLAMELAVKLQDIENQLMLLNNLAILYNLSFKYPEAEKMLRQGLSICEQHGKNYQKVQFLFSLGAHFMQRGKPDIALEIFMECEQAGKDIGLRYAKYLFDLNSNIAGCYREQGQNDQAWDRLQKAAEIADSLGDPIIKLQLNLNMANFLCTISKFTDSRKLLKEVAHYTRKHKIYDLLIMSQLNLYRSYEMEKKYPQAIDALLNLHKIHQEYHSYLTTERTKEFDQRLQELLQSNQQQLSTASEFKMGQYNGFIGRSAAHKRVLEAALLAAQHPSASVLILGESGTGKDVLARIIHQNSVRRDAPMVSVNMAAISPSLLESEFFGHKKGSFTGAISDSKGLFLEANHGTLFLDEISEMPFQLQAKLLRVLETRKLNPVGSSKEVAFDTRVISSTNRNILQMIQNDKFRLDLYHRLNTVEITIPPLRERPEDIEVLVLHYADYLAREMKAPIPRIDGSFIRRLKEYSFPGNVRELRNIVERLLIMQREREWTAKSLEALPTLNVRIGKDEPMNIKLRKANMETQDIIDALQKCGGKQKEAAKILGMSESTLTRRIAKYHLEIYTRKGK